MLAKKSRSAQAISNKTAYLLKSAVEAVMAITAAGIIMGTHFPLTRLEATTAIRFIFITIRSTCIMTRCTFTTTHYIFITTQPEWAADIMAVAIILTTMVDIENNGANSSFFFHIRFVSKRLPASQVRGRFLHQKRCGQIDCHTIKPKLFFNL